MPYPNGTYINQIQDPAVRAELQQFYSLLQGYLSAQHKDDGSHAAVTADSVADAGDLTAVTAEITGAITAEASRIAIGDMSVPPPITESVTGIDLKTPQGLSHWTVGTIDAPTSQRDLVFIDRLGSLTAFLVRQASGVYSLMPGTTSVLNLGLNGLGTRIGDIYVDGGVHERARAAAMGDWTAVSYSAGNFAGLGGGTWTVDSGDQTTFSYALLGQTLFLAIKLDTTSISGTVSQVSITIPGGFKSAHDVQWLVPLDDNGTFTTGLAFVTAGGTAVKVQRLDGSNFAAATNTTYVRFSHGFEIQ